MDDTNKSGRERRVTAVFPREPPIQTLKRGDIGESSAGAAGEAAGVQVLATAHTAGVSPAQVAETPLLMV